MLAVYTPQTQSNCNLPCTLLCFSFTLHSSIPNGHYRTVGTLLEGGAHPDKQTAGHPYLVSLLLWHPYIPHFLIRRIFCLLIKVRCTQRGVPVKWLCQDTIYMFHDHTDRFVSPVQLPGCLSYYYSYNYSYQKVVQWQQSCQMSGRMDPCCMNSPGLSTKLGWSREWVCYS